MSKKYENAKKIRKYEKHGKNTNIIWNTKNTKFWDTGNTTKDEMYALTTKKS